MICVSYWENENSIPEDVEEMIDVTKRFVQNFTYVLLTEKNFTRFLYVSDLTPSFENFSAVHKGDYVRICILAKHGGVFIDATTYINSGSEMELFFSDAINLGAEMFGFGYHGPRLDGRGIRWNFLGACHYCPLLRKFKKEWDSVLVSGVEEYCQKYIYPYKSKSFYYCIDNMFMKFQGENKELRKKTLELPLNRSHYRLFTLECNKSNKCVRERLLKDPTVRLIPFIKLQHVQRLGKKLGWLDELPSLLPKSDGEKGKKLRLPHKNRTSTNKTSRDEGKKLAL